MEQGALSKYSNLILMTTFLSSHHSLTEETEVLEHEAMCLIYKASGRPTSLI